MFKGATTILSKILLSMIVALSSPLSALEASPIITEGDVPIERDVALETVVSGLEHPWSMVWLPDGDILITERPGRVRLVRMGGDGIGQLQAGSLQGVPEVYDRGQGGLLDISLHPDFAANRLVYMTYAHGNLLSNRTRLARAVYQDGRLKDWEVLFETKVTKTGSQHFGSRMCWLPDGTLLASVGDGGNPPVRLEGRFIREHAQNLANQLGSVIRINDDGSIPEDNPFTAKTGASPDIYSYGHRNIQGLAYDVERGMVWASEHGALGGDELNRLQSRGNFGWPEATYSREYFDGSRISPHESKPGTIDPKVVWLSAIAPSGLSVYNGHVFKQWKGDLFAGGLIKQCVRHVELDAAGKVMGQREIRIGSRVRDVRQGPDGYLYVLTDEENGALIRIKPLPGGDIMP